MIAAGCLLRIHQDALGGDPTKGKRFTIELAV
jgi:hypothetical protein